MKKYKKYGPVWFNSFFACLFILILAALPASAKNIYVDAVNGKDSNPGTLKKPFQTIQYAANKMVSGDICYIKAGVYRETLVPKSDQLSFRNFENDYVIITGLDEVKGWTLYQGKIWKAGFKRPSPPGSFKASMLFVNGKRMNWARYPNEDGNMLNNDDMSLVNVNVDRKKNPDPRFLGSVVFKDKTLPTEKSWKGAYFVGLASYNVGAWFTANKGVVQESYGDSLIVNDISWNWNNGARKGRFLGEGYGYLIGHLNALDAETEWHLQNDTLYFYPPEGTDRHSDLIEARSRTLGLDLSNRKNVTVKGINFKAAGVKMEESANCIIDACTFRYASGFTGFSKNAWGDYKIGDAAIYVSGINNIVKNCYIGQTWGNGIAIWGNHNTLENSIVEHCNWQAERLANVSCPGDDNIIKGNTVRYGAREGIELGNDSWIGKYARRALVQHNHVHHLGMLCPDGGLFYVNHQGGHKPMANTEISYNIWHDYPSADFPRPHGGIYLDNMSSGYTIHHNVIWNVISGIHLNDISKDNNTHDVFIYHNTVINCKHGVRLNTGQEGSINTFDIVVQNNWSPDSEFEGILMDHNRSDRWDNEFVDARKRNYRLKSWSNSINAGISIPGINDNAVGAPDLGAYEFGGEDWTVGATFEVPEFPDEN
ncbi:MAG: right-handed parallel beta-helix repeat-containing protein [Bacteroides sp.]|nr:right-handed parallel beta-helix repeat-containing protein [Bacteroides sp.]